MTAQARGRRRVSATITGATTLSVSTSAITRLRACVAGETRIIAVVAARAQALATLAGETVISAAARAVGAPNRFASADFDSATLFAVSIRAMATVSARFAGETVLRADIRGRAGDINLEEFFALPVRPSVSVQRVRARLEVTTAGVTRYVALSAFTASAPANRPGVGLSLTLARALDRALLTDDARLTFTVGVMAAGAWTDYTLLNLGEVAGLVHTRETGAGEVRDTLTLSAVDTLAARLTRAPAAPVVLYDPYTSDYDPTAAQSDLSDEAGRVIRVEAKAHTGLDLYAVLHAAYVDGLGFAAVKTNVPNHPVSQAEFGLTGGYDAGARARLSAFDLLFYPDASDTLWILDTAAPITAELTPAPLAVSQVKRLGEAQPSQGRTTALIVSHQTSRANETASDREEVERSETGRFGDADYTRTTVTRRLREYRSVAQPNRVDRAVLLSTVSETVNASLQTIAREEQTDTYDSRTRKTGHRRTVDARVPDLTTSRLDFALLRVEDERCEISFRQHPSKPGVEVQDRVVTRTSGLVAVDDEVTYRDQPYKLPLIDAHRSGQLADGMRAEFAPLKTVTETLRVRADGELEYETRIIDHLADVPAVTRIEPRTGDATASRVSRRRVQTILRARNVAALEADGGVATFDAGELPEELALTVGRRRLRRLNSPPTEMSVELVQLDLNLHRASVRTLFDRDGVTPLGAGLVTGWRLRGAALDTPQARVEQSVYVQVLPGGGVTRRRAERVKLPRGINALAVRSFERFLMVTEKTYRVRAGEDVRLEIHRPQSGAAPPVEDASRRGVARAAASDFRYLPRRALLIEFFDLGTRLRSVPDPGTDVTRRREVGDTDLPAPKAGYFNEYVEVALDQHGEEDAEAPSPAARAAMTRALLGSRSPRSDDPLDPLGASKANVTGRRLAHALPLPYVSPPPTSLGVKLTLDSAAYVAGFLRSSPEWKNSAAGRGADERWNAINAADGLTGRGGALHLRAGGGRRLVLVSPEDYYEDFDTDDDKVTGDADFDAEEVPLAIKGKRLQVFLAPRLVRIRRHLEAGGYGYVDYEELDYQYGSPVWTSFQATISGVVLGADSQFFARLPIYPLPANDPAEQLAELLYTRTVCDLSATTHHLRGFSGTQIDPTVEEDVRGAGQSSVTAALNFAQRLYDDGKQRFESLHPEYRNVTYTDPLINSHSELEYHAVYRSEEPGYLVAIVKAENVFYVWKR